MLSIRAQLTFFYTLAAFILLTVIALFLYWETTNILYKANHRFLSNEVDAIQYILNDKTPDLSELKQEVIELPNETNGSLYRYYVRVLDHNKQLIIETPNMGIILPLDKTFNTTEKLLGKKSYWWYTNNDNNYLIMQAPIKLKATDQLGFIQVALDISYQHTLISDRRNLIIVLLAGTLCALVLGFLVTHRGMRSLYVLTETTQKITATSLHQRIDPKSWPKELGELGHAFNQMLERIETSFLRLKQFTSDLAHELRTPINNLMGETEIALAHGNSVAEYRIVLESNLEELHRVSQLMEKILFLARADNPQLIIQKAPLHINKEMAIVCEFYQAMADEKNIQLSSEGSIIVDADPILFRRMISNILSNAIKYTPSGGWVRLKAKEIDASTVQIICNDNGVGISAEHLPKLFDRFYRVDNSRAQYSGGTGLGLAIVKTIVDLHQGTISILSKPENGTTVIITLKKIAKGVAE